MSATYEDYTYDKLKFWPVVEEVINATGAYIVWECPAQMYVHPVAISVENILPASFNIQGLLLYEWLNSFQVVWLNWDLGRGAELLDFPCGHYGLVFKPGNMLGVSIGTYTAPGIARFQMLYEEYSVKNVRSAYERKISKVEVLGQPIETDPLGGIKKLLRGK